MNDWQKKFKVIYMDAPPFGPRFSIYHGKFGVLRNWHSSLVFGGGLKLWPVLHGGAPDSLHVFRGTISDTYDRNNVDAIIDGSAVEGAPYYTAGLLALNDGNVAVRIDQMWVIKITPHGIYRYGGMKSVYQYFPNFPLAIDPATGGVYVYRK